MNITKREIGFLAGIAVALIVWFAPLPGIEGNAKLMLAFALMTVVWWALQIAQNGYTAGVLLALMCIFQLDEPAEIFYAWTGTTMWLVIGAYLIANAVKTSGLGERIAYSYMLRFVTGFRSIIIGIFALTAILSLLIPHPWPRAFLIMAVMAVIIQSSGISKADAVKIGFAVFAASVPCSLIFITGDAVINPLAASYAGGADFVTWLKVMGVPAIIMSIITLILFLALYRPERDYSIDKDAIRGKLADMGKMSGVEVKTIVWVLIAIVLWFTESIHGIDIGWVTFAVGMLMSMPIIGDLNAAKDWSAVPIHVLVFLTAAMAIGHVGADTGMNAWIASFMPTSVPDNMFIIAAIIVALSFAVHMLLGSVIAVMGVAVPAILAFAQPLGIDPMVATMICYMAVAAHYLFPFQHLNTLVGASPDTGNYTQKETLKLGIALIPVLFLMGWVMVGWFGVIGML